jgi:glycosyltransferase involved in cell wall biosynthesis
MRRALLRLCRLFRCRFVAISDALRRRVAALLCVEPDEIGVAHDGYDPALFSKLPDRAETRRRLGLADETFAICYVGSAATLGAEKGVRFIAEAFRRAALPDATLLLAGIEQQEDAPGVRCLGRIPHEKIAALLTACDGAVVSFPENVDYARAMSPLKLFEYLAAGLPVIAPDLPNLREVLDESCALFVPLTEAAALTGAMTRLRTDAALRARLAAGAAERAPAHTWDARAERLLAFLRLPPA